MIQHRGIVENINGTQLIVKINQTSACVSCSAKGHCSSADQKEKKIEITDYSGRYHPGDEVMIYGATSMGVQAVIIAFVLPFCLLITGLFASMSFTSGNELCSAFIALSLLIPYYIGVYLNRHRLKKNFSFTLKPIK